MPGEYSQRALENHFNAINERLRAIEAQLEKVSDAAGVSYEERNEDVPPEVIQLVRDGNNLEAAKLLREMTGVDTKEAMEVIAGI